MQEIYKSEKFKIQDFEKDGIQFRALFSNNAIQSMCYKDIDKLFLIPQNYIFLYNIIFHCQKDIKSLLCLGGGGMTYPKYVISHYPNTNVTVVEKSSEVIDISKKYFFLDELQNLYDKDHTRLAILNEDAIDYVKRCQVKFSAILIDLFDDTKPVEEIYEKDTLSKIKTILEEDGIILNNYIYSNDTKEVFIKNISILKEHFKFIKIMTLEDYFNFDKLLGNILLLISNRDIVLPSSFPQKIIEIDLSNLL